MNKQDDKVPGNTQDKIVQVNTHNESTSEHRRQGNSKECIRLQSTIENPINESTSERKTRKYH